MNNTKSKHGQTELIILKGAVENANEAFITIDEESTVLFYNKAAELIFGYPAEEVLGKNLSVVLSYRCKEGHSDGVARFVREKRGNLIGHESEFEMERKNGDFFIGTISFSVAEIQEKFYFTGIVRDVTREKEMRAELYRAEQLADLGKAIAEISHEIKNPLVMIGGSARQLSRKVENDKKKKLEIIISEVERLEKLLADMRELYVSHELVEEIFCLRELVREVHALVEANMEDSGISIKIKESGSNFHVSGDRQKLKQVFLNVLKNAFESMKDEGDIEVGLSQKADSVNISISDKGHGIPKKIQDKIFKPFFTTKKKGTGLGLSISKRIVEELCGGAFEVKSEEGKGTEVTIALRKGKERNL